MADQTTKPAVLRTITRSGMRVLRASRQPAVEQAAGNLHTLSVSAVAEKRHREREDAALLEDYRQARNLWWNEGDPFVKRDLYPLFRAAADRCIERGIELRDV